MEFESPLVEAELVRRYKRFLADVVFEDGRQATAHCPNTGSMFGCQTPGSRVWLMSVDNPKRKYPLSWELVEVHSGALVGINTNRSNALVAEALSGGVISALDGYQSIKREVTLTDRSTRLDFFLREHPTAPDCYLEVKNVTAKAEEGFAFFPDAISARATRHLEVLGALVGQGYRAALVFCVQRSDVDQVRPADEIDANYGVALRLAASVGVEVYAYRADVSPQGVNLNTRVQVCLD
ncbi:MAG: DNA/RNA nuclease SfsA [Gammaproteobacteria bacterium]